MTETYDFRRRYITRHSADMNLIILQNNPDTREYIFFPTRRPMKQFSVSSPFAGIYESVPLARCIWLNISSVNVHRNAMVSRRHVKYEKVFHDKTGFDRFKS